MLRVSDVGLARVAGALVLLGSGCGVQAFQCQSNANCSGVEDGQCEASGFCSQPAADCDSGRRYTELSGSLSGVCVPLDTGAATAGSDDDPTAGSVPTGSDDTGPSVADTGAASSSGTGAVITGGLDTSDTTGASGGSSDETGAPVVGPCAGGSIAMTEDFSRGGLDPQVWQDQTLGTGAVSVADEALALEVGAAGQGAHYWWSITTQSVAVPGSVLAQVIEAPGADDPEQVWVSMLEAGADYYIDVTSGMLRAVFSPEPTMFEPRHEIPFDATEHAWLRLTLAGDPLVISAQTSPNGIDWTEFYAFDEGTPTPDSVRVSVGGGASTGATAGVFAVLDNILVCEL